MKGETRPAGEAAKRYVIDWLGGPLVVWEVNLVTRKDKKERYGRYLGDIYFNGGHLNAALVTAGHAVRAEYR